MKLVNINNQQYSVYIHRRDEQLPWLLLLHGFMGDSRVFEHLINDLSNCCNPITVDLLGHGQSSKPTNPERYREEHQLSDLADLIRKLSISPIFLHGYSMGGRLALKLALYYSELCCGLILESTTNGIAAASDRKKRQKVDESRANQIERNFAQFLEKWEQAALFRSPFAGNQTLKKQYENIHSSQEPKSMAASLRGFGTGSMTPESSSTKKFSKPTLVLAGSNDEKYKQIAKDQLTSFFPEHRISFIEAGHRIHLDNPPKFVKEIRTHITSNSLS